MRDSVSIPNHKIRSSVKFLKGCDDRRPRLERPEPGHVAEMWFRRGRRRIYLHARHIEDAYSRSDCSQVDGGGQKLGQFVGVNGTTDVVELWNSARQCMPATKAKLG